MIRTMKIERLSEDRLHVRRWLFEVHFDWTSPGTPKITLTLTGYDSGLRASTRHRNLIFDDRRRWGRRLFRAGRAVTGWSAWVSMTHARDMDDTRWADVCDAPPLPTDVAEEVRATIMKGLTITVPDSQDPPQD